MRKKVELIETERLIMREIQEKDTLRVVQLRSIPEIYQYFNSPKPVTEEEHRGWYLEHYIENDNRIDFMVLEKNSGKEIGVFHIKRDTDNLQSCEFGYLLDRVAWGKGYAREAVKRLMIFAKEEWGCKESILTIHEENTRSRKLAYNLGYEEKARKGKFIFYHIALTTRGQNGPDRPDKKCRFYIRADGNEKIGMGHLMRCLTIAEAFCRLGEKVLFITADEKPVEIIEQRGFAAKVLSTRYDDMEAELPQLTAVLAGDGDNAGCAEKPKILVDSYFVTFRYLEKLRTMAKVILMDDEKKAVYPCDGLVNYNIFGKALGYEKDYPAATKLFLGCEYVPLREQFRDCAYTVREKAEHILLTTGGGDRCHMALAMAKRLTEKNGIEGKTFPVWHIVCGFYHPDTTELEKLAAKCDILRIHKNVTCMAELMRSCDVAVSAAGSTFYELASIGIPAVGFYFVENQRKNMETFAKLTPIKNAGDFSAGSERVLDLIEEEVERLCREKALREEISQRMKTIVDGRGAERLAKAFYSL